MTAAVSAHDLLTKLYASAATLIESMTVPAVIDDASLKDCANALNAIGRFVAMLHKYEELPLPARDSGTDDGQPRRSGELAAIASNAAAANVRLSAPFNAAEAPTLPALNRHERRQRDALLRRSKSGQS